MNKALTLDVGRQTILSASVALAFDNLADTAVAVKAVNLPYGATILGGFIVVDVAFDNTTATLDVGDLTVANRYANDVNLKALGMTALTLTGYTSDGDAIYVIPTLTGPAATVGSARLIVNYVIKNRAGETQPN